MTARPLISKTDQSAPTNETQTPSPATHSNPAAPSDTPSGRYIDTDDRVIAVSVALRQSEFDELQQMADDLHGSRGSLMSALLRRAMRDLRAGRVRFERRGIRLTEIEPES